MRIIFFFFLAAITTQAQGISFDSYFEDAVMRIDYYHTGDSDTEIFTIDRIYKYRDWGRNRNKLIDNFNNGRYYIKIYDEQTGVLIYSKGMDSYFGEYQTSSDALKGIRKTFHESAIIPYPHKNIKFTIEKRNREKLLHEIYTTVIDPKHVDIIQANPADKNVSVYKCSMNGPSEECVDVVILGEGYSESEYEKFVTDINRFTSIFFDVEPYKSLKNKFNLYGVLKFSTESGVDEPRAGIFKETTLNATFNSLGSERYLLTEDNKTMRDLAAYVPYDAVYIMVNHNRYGGGGIYNLYCTFTADAQFSKYLFIHEFGHSFGGLADEYYTSSTAYNDFYPRGVEPVEPNITALLSKNRVKWSEYLTEGIEIPTPWEKQDFDDMDMKWQKERTELNNKIAELKRNKAPSQKIVDAEKDYAVKDKEHSEIVDKYLKSSRYWNKVGVFEGAGYSSKGLYRPMLDCIMFSKGEKPFCVVCEAAIRKVIKHYTE
ncbi:MAG: peptidase M64 [Melioribacteraceae bacterium]|nr:peptidase M64 [Melioribacteraceae bacterium]